MQTTQLTREQLIARIDELTLRERKMIKLNSELTLRIERSDLRYKQLKNNLKQLTKNA